MGDGEVRSAGGDGAAGKAGAPVLEARAVSRWYRAREGGAGLLRPRRVQVLFDVSVALRRDHTVAIIGGSGSGKTTLSSILLGLTRPDGGEVLFHGESLARADVRAALRRSSGIVFQSPFASLDPRWPIGRSVAEPLRIQRPELGADAIRSRAWHALESVGLDPDRYFGRFPTDLSGGQNQRAAIARAIVNEPQVLLADEPMSAVDVPTRIQILRVLSQVTGRARESGAGMATVIVSHDLGVVQHIADHILVLHDGHAVEYGETAAVLGDPRHEYTKTLLAAASI